MNDSLTAEIRAWLRAGAEVTAGLLLFSQFSNNTRFASLVKIKPAKYRPLLIEKLCTLAGITPPSEEARPARRRFRDDFPFLRAPDCPPELKILAADKITAHERYIQAHERLFDCTTLNECTPPPGRPSRTFWKTARYSRNSTTIENMVRYSANIGFSSTCANGNNSTD